MAFKASVSVLFGGNFSQANKLLAAAENGNRDDVAEVLTSKPQLACYTGFHGTTSPLHKAAAKGHLEVCRAIIDLIKLRIQVAEQAETDAAPKTSKAVRKWRTLLDTVLNQRTHKSLTPLMLACDKGHYRVVDYLLSQGADPLAVDLNYSRSCLHYAAANGHVDCLRVLLKDTTTVDVEGTRRVLRDVIVSDIQIKSARFIDQRSFGGLTPLHFAVVSGNVDAVRVLVARGAALMVRTDSEAFIGEESLIPGSSPLHVAVMLGNVSIVHSLLAAHAEMMNIAGLGLDERGRRPWEGHSRTDIRSVRNSLRKLPYHVARERGWTHLMQLVDPRVPIDHSLDAARDTEHGIGTKRLSTICSQVLQASLMGWLDACATELEQEQRKAAAVAPLPSTTGAPAVVSVPGTMTRQQSAALLSKAPRASPRASMTPIEQVAAAASALNSGMSSPVVNTSGFVAASTSTSQHASLASSPQHSTLVNRPSSPSIPLPTIYSSSMSSGAYSGAYFNLESSSSAPPELSSPFAEEAQHRQGPFGNCHMQMSAPSTPERAAILSAAARHTINSSSNVSSPVRGTHAAHASAPAVPALDIARGDSLRAYVGMLSEKRTLVGSMRRVGTATEPLMALATASSVTLQPYSQSQILNQIQQDAGVVGGGSNTAAAQGGQSSSLAAGFDGTNFQTRNTAAAGGLTTRGATTRTLHDGTVVTTMPRYAGITAISAGATRAQTVASFKRTLSALSMALFGTVPPSEEGGDGDVDASPRLDSGIEDKGLGKLGADTDSEAGLCKNSDSASSQEETECGVCLDMAVEVAFAGCHHKLCLDCARNLTRQERKPPNCPFCRQMVTGFNRVSAYQIH